MKNRPTASLRPLRLTALASLLMLSLAACSGKDEGSGQQATQVAAKVGDSEISVHQINQVLGQTQLKDTSKEAVQAASRQILERLIDQQLAVDAATEDKLHRSPEVVSALEAARREVLARAYVQKLTGAVAKPTPEDVKAYYKEHPALFAERRIYNIQEIRVPEAGPVLADLRSMADQGKPIEEVANFLRGKGVKFGGGSATRSAEQVPLDLLPRLHALKDGQLLLLENAGGATVLRLAGSQQVPVGEEQAAPGIAQFLFNRRNTEAVTAEIKRLREASKITYLGEFERSAAPAASAAASAPAAAATPSVTSGTESTATTPEQAAIERGLQGLK